MTPAIVFSPTSVLYSVEIFYFVESLQKPSNVHTIPEMMSNVAGEECKHTPFIEQDMNNSIPVLHSDEMSSRTDLNSQPLLLPHDVEIKVEPAIHYSITSDLNISQ